MEKSNKTQKIMGAVFSSVAIGIFFLVMVFAMTFFQFTEEEFMPTGVYFFVICLYGLPLLGIIINLVFRIREVLGGEEDEASKY